jgi:two-component system response regulator FlrC
MFEGGAPAAAAAFVAAAAVAPAPTFAAPPPAGPSPEGVGAAALPGQPANMKDLERTHILETLAKVGGSRKKAVELLGISERTLRYKLAQYRDEGFLAPEE